MSKKKKYGWKEADEDIYDEEYVAELLEDDEISAEEQAFMNGYNQAI